jgi:hypothetical protein
MAIMKAASGVEDSEDSEDCTLATCTVPRSSNAPVPDEDDEQIADIEEDVDEVLKFTGISVACLTIGSGSPSRPKHAESRQ